MASPIIALTTASDDDFPFLVEVYASTRADVAALADWSAEEKLVFVSQQLDLQHRSYDLQFPGHTRALVVVDGVAAGRLYVHRTEDEIHVIDIALLPAFRGRGLGSRLLAGILAEGDRTGRPVTIYVEKPNPARNLYLRLGFVPSEHDQLYDFMRREPLTPGAG